MFAKKEKALVAQLQQQAIEQADELTTTSLKHAEDLARLSRERSRDADREREASLRAEDRYKTAMQEMKDEHAQEIAELNGRLAVYKEELESWHYALSFGPWHSDNSVDIEGTEVKVRSSRRDNPLANFRLPTKPGKAFP